MKKTYDTPRLQTERFDTEDVITASSPAQTFGTLDVGNTNWEITGFPLN